MENKRSVYSFFSWKNLIIGTVVFFVLTMLLEYLLDRKDYPNLEVLFRENALRKAIVAIIFGAVMTYGRAKYLHKEFEMNAD